MVPEIYHQAFFNLFDLGRGFRVEADEDHPFFPGFFIVAFQQSIGADIAVENKYLGLGIEVFYFEGVLDGTLTADARTIGVFLVPGADTLDHGHLGQILGPFFFETLGQLNLSHHFFALAVEIFPGLIFGSPGGNEGHTVVDLALVRAWSDEQLGSEVSLETGKSDYQSLGQDLNQGMGRHPFDQTLQIGLNIISFNGKGQTVGHAPQLFFFFNQHHFIPLIGQSQGGIHSGHPAADNQRRAG